MLLKQSKNSTMRTRLLLGLGLICLTLVAAPLTMYMLQNGRTLQSVSLKRGGIASLKALLRMVRLLQQHRGLSASVLGGSTTLEAQRAAKQIETDKAVEAFDAIVTSDIHDPALTAAWRRAPDAWRALANGVSSRSISSQESFVKHTVLIDDNLKLLDLLLDYFGFSHDLTGHDHHITTALLVHMPPLTEFLGQARAHGMLSLVSKSMKPADRIALIGSISNIERQYWYVADELGEATALDPLMTAELSGTVTASKALVQKAVDLARSQTVKVEVLRSPPAEYWAVFTQAIDAQFELIDKGLAHLDGTLQMRVAAVHNAQLRAIGFTVLATAFALWLGVMIIRTLKEDIATLEQSEKAQRRYAGELAVTVERLKQALVQLEGHRRWWEQIHRLDVLLSQSLRLEDIYPALAHAIKVLIPYDRIALVVPEGRQLRVALSVAEPPLASHQGEVWSQAEECAAQWALDHRTPRLVQDLAIEATYRDERYLAQEGIRSTVWIPLLAGGEALWVLCLDHRTPQMYSPGDLELLSPMVEQLALVLQNTSLYEAQHRATSELTTMIEKLEQTQSRLEQTQSHLLDVERLRAMGQMAAGVAHDFNNALMGILGQAQLMRLILERGPVAAALQGVEGGTRLLECLARQEQVALDAAETIRKIREATRPRNEETFRPVALDELIEQVLAITRPRWKGQAEAAGVQITVRTDVAQTPPVLGHAAELREAFTNLLFNALDAMPQGGTITITTRHVRSCERRGWVTLSMTDTGVGMPPAVQARIFEPFFSTKGMRGTGLGLSMVHGIVSRHQGEITIQSAERQGTTVTLRLPVAEAEAAEATSPPDASLPIPGPLKLLVIDDVPLLAETLSDLLRLLGHEATIATSGEDGLTRLAAEHFDLVLTDLGMPEMSGWEVAQAVKAQWPQLPVILVTGWGDALKEEHLEVGRVDAVLAKPYTMAQLQDALAQCSVGPG